jgi:hypothetical protein
MSETTVIVFERQTPIPPMDTVTSKIKPLELQMPLTVKRGVDLNFQVAFLQLVDFRPASQQPTDDDLKPKLRYRHPG